MTNLQFEVLRDMISEALETKDESQIYRYINEAIKAKMVSDGFVPVFVKAGEKIKVNVSGEEIEFTKMEADLLKALKENGATLKSEGGYYIQNVDVVPTAAVRRFVSLGLAADYGNHAIILTKGINALAKLKAARYQAALR